MNQRDKKLRTVRRRIREGALGIKHATFQFYDDVHHVGVLCWCGGSHIILKVIQGTITVPRATGTYCYSADTRQSSNGVPCCVSLSARCFLKGHKHEPFLFAVFVFWLSVPNVGQFPPAINLSIQITTSFVSVDAEKVSVD